MKIKNRLSSIGIAFCLVLTMTFQYSISYADEALPRKYKNKVTSVKNQGKLNSCWAFAALASLESCIKTKNGTDFNFSENNMITNHGFDWSPSKGGNIDMATAYLSSWKGAVLESEDPYSGDGNPINRGIKKSDYHVQNVIYIPKRENFNDNDKIKKQIIENGAVYTNLKWDDSYWNFQNKTYRNTGLKGYNHAVTIVGWDDDFSKDKFKKSGNCDNGAFICKNSWGTSKIDDGYFYVSYYDFNIGKTENAVFLASDEDYDNIYQYDELGCTDEYGFSTDTAWFSNIFEAKGNNEKLSGTSFYTRGENSDYEIYVCRDYENLDSLKNMNKVANGKIEYRGYHTISFKPIELKESEKFAVIVKIKTKGKKNPIAIETQQKGYSSKAKANENESFVSVDGKKWTDISKDMPNTNVCLKAFTKKEKKINTNKEGKTEKIGDLEIQRIEKNDFSDEGTKNIAVKIKNKGNEPQNVALMVGLYDANNKMVDHSCINKSIKENEEVVLLAGVCISDKNKYTLRGFIWDDADQGKCIIKNAIEIDIN